MDLGMLGGFLFFAYQEVFPLILDGPVQILTSEDRKGYPAVEGEAHRGVISAISRREGSTGLVKNCVNAKRYSRDHNTDTKETVIVVTRLQPHTYPGHAET